MISLSLIYLNENYLRLVLVVSVCFYPLFFSVLFSSSRFNFFILDSSLLDMQRIKRLSLTCDSTKYQCEFFKPTMVVPKFA